MRTVRIAIVSVAFHAITISARAQVSAPAPSPVPFTFQGGYSAQSGPHAPFTAGTSAFQGPGSPQSDPQAPSTSGTVTFQGTGFAQSGFQAPSISGTFTFQGPGAQISTISMGGANAGMGTLATGLTAQNGQLNAVRSSPFMFEENIYRPLALPGFIPPVASAMPAAFSLQAKISQTFEYDDNPLLTTATPAALVGSITGPEFLISGGTPDANASLDTIVDVNQFNLAGFSSQDVHSNLTSSIDQERLLASLNANLDYDTTRTSEVNLTGVNQVGIRHTGITISPEIGYRLSAIDEILVDGSFEENDYSDTVTYTDFRIYTVRPSYVHSLDQNNSIIGFVGYTKYDTLTGTPVNIESFLPGLGWQTQITPRLKASFSAGLDETRSRVLGGSSSKSSGYTYDVKLIYGLNQSLDQITLSLSHNLTPVSSGTEITQTTFELQERHQFSSRFSANASFLYQTNQVPNADPTVQKSFFSAAAKVNYALTSDLTVSGTFRHRHRDFFLSQNPAESDSVLLSITFAPNAVTLGL